MVHLNCINVDLNQAREAYAMSVVVGCCSYVSMIMTVATLAGSGKFT